MSDWDIALNGQHYMVAPGSYRAFQDGMTDSRLGRQKLTEFTSGQGHARPVLAGEASGGLLSGAGAWPAPWPAGGIGPGPVKQPVSGTIAADEPKLTASDRDWCYIAAGNNVYRWSRDVAVTPAWRAQLAAAARCMTRFNNVLYIGYGAAADVGRYDDATNTLTASALGAGVQAALIGTFSRSVVLVDPIHRYNLHVYYGNTLAYLRTWRLDGAILNFTQHGDAMIVATDGGLHRLTGEWFQDSDPPAPSETLRLTSWGTLAGQLQDDDDFAWMTVFNGRLMAWLGKRVVIFDEAHNWWRHAGLEGGATHGAAVVNGWLLTAISPRTSATTHQLWAYNGSGWWLLEENASSNTFAGPATDGGGKLLTFHAAVGALQAYDLDDATPANLTSPFSARTPLLDGGEPDRCKFWRRVGVELARPDGRDVGDWSIGVSYSADGGATWVSAGAATAVTTELQTVAHAIAATSAGLLVEVVGTRVSGPPPMITTIWVEYEVLNESVRRRRWQLRVHARSRGINRAGAPDARSGQEIRGALWSLWDDAATVPFRDVDYAASPVERNVRLIGIREEWPKPADQAELGADSMFELTLVEV